MISLNVIVIKSCKCGVSNQVVRQFIMFTAGLSGGNGQQTGGERPPQREVKRSNLSAAPPPSTTKVTPSICRFYWFRAVGLICNEHFAYLTIFYLPRDQGYSDFYLLPVKNSWKNSNFKQNNINCNKIL